MIITHLPTSRRNLSSAWLAITLSLVLLGRIVVEFASRSAYAPHFDFPS
jgi:hypothetical protein